MVPLNTAPQHTLLNCAIVSRILPRPATAAVQLIRCHCRADRAKPRRRRLATTAQRGDTLQLVAPAAGCRVQVDQAQEQACSTFLREHGQLQQPRRPRSRFHARPQTAATPQAKARNCSNGAQWGAVPQTFHARAAEFAWMSNTQQCLVYGQLPRSVEFVLRALWLHAKTRKT